MDRRTFLGVASAAVLMEGHNPAAALMTPPPAPLKPMELGLKISLSKDPEATLRRVRDLGFTNCFPSFDSYIGNFTPQLATQIRDLLAKYSLTATTVEVVGPPPLVWNFTQGPATIGLVQ